MEPKDRELICGIDEAGRGPLAGPVTAAAVILPARFPFDLLGDSKRLTERQRDRAAQAIRDGAVAWAVGWASPEEIDRLNILQASLLAMRRAWEGLSVQPSLVLVDGPFIPPIDAPCRAIVRGDTYLRPIQAASIIAKTERDRWMVEYAKRDGRYGFERHKGYPTAEHRRLCRVYGLSPIHRRSFTIRDPEHD